MKNIITLLIFMIIGYSVYSQCDPDPLCVDTGEPGQMCPDSMPDGQVNEAYFQTITIWAPSTIDFEGNPINLSHLKIVDITNIPQGLTWQSNAVDDLFEVGTSYCVLIEGIPEVMGEYPLEIEVRPYIFSIPVPSTIVDDSSLSILIKPPLGIFESGGSGFSVENAFPNPFEYSSEININSNTAGLVEFSVFDNIGRIVMFQKKLISDGSNKLIFKGSEFEKGIYNYIIRFEDRIITGKVVKI